MMADQKLEQRFTSEADAIDDVYGEYPFILFKHLFITRHNIPKFCKMMTSINARLSLGVEERNIIEHLEILITQKLH
jgi:hypothetical protein